MPMFEGNWPCSSCGAAITQLPFQPKSDKGLTCRDCWSKSKGGSSSAVATPAPSDLSTSSAPMPSDDVPAFDESQLAGEPAPAAPFEDGAVPVAPGEKPKFEGSWQYASCGGAITSLPFQPRSTDNLKCLDCFKASRG
jgi:CxxC-x17-CxxC domain-containing protein